MHLIIRGALDHALRRGLVTRNVALSASAPKLRTIPKIEQKAWTATEVQASLRAAAGQRLFPALWLSANTGIRRNELLGLRWTDLDIDHARLSINRGLVAVVTTPRSPKPVEHPGEHHRNPVERSADDIGPGR